MHQRSTTFHFHKKGDATPFFLYSHSWWPFSLFLVGFLLGLFYFSTNSFFSFGFNLGFFLVVWNSHLAWPFLSLNMDSKGLKNIQTTPSNDSLSLSWLSGPIPVLLIQECAELDLPVWNHFETFVSGIFTDGHSWIKSRFYLKRYFQDRPQKTNHFYLIRIEGRASDCLRNLCLITPSIVTIMSLPNNSRNGRTVTTKVASSMNGLVVSLFPSDALALHLCWDPRSIFVGWTVLERFETLSFGISLTTAFPRTSLLDG